MRLAIIVLASLGLASALGLLAGCGETPTLSVAEGVGNVVWRVTAAPANAGLTGLPVAATTTVDSSLAAVLPAP